MYVEWQASTGRYAMLCLTEIQKRTEKSQGDYTCLEDAIHKLEEVMT